MTRTACSHLLKRWVVSASLCLVVGLAAAQPTGAQPHTKISPVIISSALHANHEIALTFDDGPSPYTPEVLTILHRYRAEATFFVVGVHVVTFPSLIQAEIRAGHVVGNHTYTHADLEWMSDGGIVDQLTRTQTAVHATIRVSPQWFRPPYGAVDARVTAIAASMGLHTVIWSVDPRDWSRPGELAIVARVLSTVRDGSIVLLHDGGGDRSETVAALPIILSALKARGYSFVTLDTLFHLTPDHTVEKHPFLGLVCAVGGFSASSHTGRRGAAGRVC